jgi:hypothetical protein
VSVRARLLVALCALAAVAGCGSSTAIELGLYHADLLGGDQVQLQGWADGLLIHESTVPDGARPLAGTEDVRIVFDDGLAGRLVTIQARLLEHGAVLDSQSGMDVLVAHRTKALYLYFVAPPSADGGAP